jgi:hypothetical protein
MPDRSKSGEKTQKNKASVRDYSHLEKRIIEMLKEGTRARLEIREELLRYVED